MNKLWTLVGALALALVPAFAGGEECKKECGDSKECAECSECDGASCDVEKVYAKVTEALDAAAKTRAEAAVAFTALPEAKQKELASARDFLMGNCPGAKASMASWKASAKLLANAVALDKAMGVTDSPNAKLVAKLAATYFEVGKAMGCCADEKECCLTKPAQDSKTLVAAAEEAVKEGEDAAAAQIAIPEAMKALKPEVAAKLQETMKFVMAECPCVKSMGATYSAVLHGFKALTVLETSAVEDSKAELAATRALCVDVASNLMKNACASCEKSGEGEKACDSTKATSSTKAAPSN